MIKINQDLFRKNGLRSIINQKNIETLTKKSKLKHQCEDQVYAIFNGAYIVVKGTISVTNPDNTKKN